MTETQTAGPTRTTEINPYAGEVLVITTIAKPNLGTPAHNRLFAFPGGESGDSGAVNAQLGKIDLISNQGTSEDEEKLYIYPGEPLDGEAGRSDRRMPQKRTTLHDFFIRNMSNLPDVRGFLSLYTDPGDNNYDGSGLNQSVIDKIEDVYNQAKEEYHSRKLGAAALPGTGFNVAPGSLPESVKKEVFELRGDSKTVPLGEEEIGVVIGRQELDLKTYHKGDGVAISLKGENENTTIIVPKGGSYIVGRGVSVNDFPSVAEDGEVSRRHMRILVSPDGKTVTIQDLMSTNGTRVVISKPVER